jgi:hypothetical protein
VVDYIDRFIGVTNKVQAVAQTVKYSFFPSLDLCLPTHCRCRGLLSYLITLKETHTHTHSEGLPWTNYQPDKETSTGKQTTLTRDRHQ